MEEKKKAKAAPKKKTAAKKAAEDKLVSEQGKADVDDLVALDKEEKAQESKPEEKPQEAVQEAAPVADNTKAEAAKPAEEKHDVSSPDPVEQALKEAAATDAADEMQKESKDAAKSQEELSKNVYEPIVNWEQGEEDCEKAVEAKRQLFATDMKKSRTLSTVVMAVLCAGLILGFVLNYFLGSDLKWIVYTIFGILMAFIIVALIYSARQRKKLYASVDVFVNDAMTIVDSYVFTDKDFAKAQVAYKGHIDLNQVTGAHYFDTINAVNSRNIVTLYFLDKPMTVSEVAARVPYQTPADGKDHSKDDAKKKPTESYGIFGKIVNYPVSLPEGAAFILLLKGTNAYLPTYLDGYKETKVPGLKEDFLCWTINEEVALKSLLKPDVLNVLNSIESDANLENVIVSVNARGLLFCFNYNESVMEIPMEKPVNGTPYLHYKKDIAKAKSFISALAEK
jgi:hypothetical protein